MNKERMLVLLVVADVFLAFAVIGVELVLNWTLPDSLQDYVISTLWLPSSPWTFALFALWSATVTCAIAAWIALLSHWWFARRLYVIGWASWTLLVLLSGPSVLTPVGAALDMLESLVGGAILGLVYFSDLSRRFERKAEGVSAAARATA